MSNELFLFILLMLACVLFLIFVIIWDNEINKLKKQNKWLSESLSYYQQRNSKKDDMLNEILQVLKKYNAE